MEHKLEEIPTPKGRKGAERRQRNQQILLNQILRVEEAEEEKTKKFRDPAAMFKRS